MPFDYVTTDYIRAQKKKREEKTKEGEVDGTIVSSHNYNHYGTHGQCMCNCIKCEDKEGGCICHTCSGWEHWGCPRAMHKEDNAMAQ
jgi:hypothetical protein